MTVERVTVGCNTCGVLDHGTTDQPATDWHPTRHDQLDALADAHSRPGHTVWVATVPLDTP